MNNRIRTILPFIMESNFRLGFVCHYLFNPDITKEHNPANPTAFSLLNKAFRNA